MTRSHITRRAFIRDLGRGGAAVAILGLTAAACSDDEPTSTTTASTDATTTTTAQATTTAAAATTTQAPAPDRGEAFAWERVDLGFVSAYVLARNGEAVIVDTGVEGSEGAIENSLTALGLDWGAVGHVVVTHLHNDHQGSLPSVLTLAPDAAGYAGGADIPGIDSPRELVAVGDGDTVFGLEIIATPGHTPGHISVLDEAGGLLVAGDALNGSDGKVIGANPDFTSDLVAADASVVKLGTFTYETVVFGHGAPVSGAASQQVFALGASL